MKLNNGSTRDGSSCRGGSKQNNGMNLRHSGNGAAHACEVSPSAFSYAENYYMKITDGTPLAACVAEGVGIAL